MSLQTNPPSPISEVIVGKPYTVTVPLDGSRGQSFFGIIKSIEGVQVHWSGAESTTELSASVVFSIWDRSTNAPFGYSANWIETGTAYFTDYGIHPGDTVILKDLDSRHGTAQVTSIGARELSLANFTGALKVRLQLGLTDSLVLKVIDF